MLYTTPKKSDKIIIIFYTSGFYDVCACMCEENFWFLKKTTSLRCVVYYVYGQFWITFSMHMHNTLFIPTCLTYRKYFIIAMNTIILIKNCPGAHRLRDGNIIPIPYRKKNLQLKSMQTKFLTCVRGGGKSGIQMDRQAVLPSTFCKHIRQGDI